MQPFAGAESTVPATQLPDVEVTAPRRVNPLQGNDLQSLIPQERQQQLVQEVNRDAEAQALQSQRLAQIDQAYSSDRKAMNKGRVAPSGDSGTITTGTPESDRAGNRASFLYNEVLNGIGRVAAGLGDVGVQLTNKIYGIDNGDEVLKAYREEFAPGLRTNYSDLLGAELDKGLEAKYKNETFTGALGGLAQSVPAIGLTIGSGGLGTGAMFLQSYDNSIESINQSEEGRNLDEGTKTFFAGGVGLVTAALEKYGLDKIFKGETGVISNLIAKNALKKATAETGGKVTGDAFTKFLDAEIIDLSNKFAKGGIKALDGALVEYGTEALQEGAQAGAELLVNSETGKPVFDTTETGTWDGFLRRMNKAGVSGAIGGGLLGSVASLGGIKKSDIDARQSELNEINTALESGELSETANEVLVQQKIQVQEALQKDADKVDEAYEKLDDKQKQRVNEIVGEKVKLEEALADENIPESVKKSLTEQTDALDKELAKIKPSETVTEENAVETTPKDQESSTEPKKGDTVGYNINGESLQGEYVGKSENGLYEIRKPDGSIESVDALETIKQPLNEETQPTVESENVETTQVPQTEEATATTGEESVKENVSSTRENEPTGEVGVSAEVVQPASNDNTGNGTEDQGSQEKVSAIKNADIANKRKELGLEPREEVVSKSNDELVTKAKTKIKEGYDTNELITDILDSRSERAGKVTDEEVVILKQYQLAKEDELIKLNDKIVEATEQGKGVAVDRLVQERDNALEDLDRAYRAGEQAGTVTARALQARRIAMLNDYSLANMLIQKRKANGGTKLTQEQIKETSDEYNRIKKLSEELEKKVQKLELENINLKANDRIRAFKNRESGRTQTKEQIDKSIEDTVTSLKKKLKDQRSKLSANAIPLDMIPDIAKLAKLYTQKGIVNLQGVVDKIYTDLSNDIEGLTKDDIKDIIANYDYETEEQQNRRSEAFKKRTGKKIEELNDRLGAQDFTKRKLPPIKLDKEGQELQDELRRVKREWDLAVEKDKLNQRTKLEKFRDGAADILNIPRSLMASLDFSAPLRQGLVLSVGRPVTASKAFIEMFRQATSQKRFDRWLDDLKETPQYSVMKQSGLYLADPSRASIQAREEQFMSNLAEKIPVIGKGFAIKGRPVGSFKLFGKTINPNLNLIGGSERAYVAYLNKLRADAFTQSASVFEEDGYTVENSPELYKALASYINTATGRGSLGSIENSAQILNSLFFSPRLIASRLNLLSGKFLAAPKQVRNMYIQDMVKTLSVGTTILALAAFAGADVEKDPRSSDFGKIRFGDTRWDIWGGHQQFVRFFSQLITGQRKNTRDKAIREINGEGFKGETRADLALNMVRSKLAPVPALTWNLLAGRNLVGEKFGLEEVPKSFLPLSASDLYSAIGRDGAKAIVTQGLPSIFGVGVQTYGDKTSDKKDFLNMSRQEQREYIQEAVRKAKEAAEKNK